MHPHDNTLPGKIDCVCEICGNTFQIKRSAYLKGRGHYCSRPCRSAADTTPVLERFWTKVQKTETCWNWTAALNPKGYGAFCVEKRTRHDELAHRFSYQIHYGEIPNGLFVCHTCDNPSCVNPDHLFLGTPDDNMQDKVAKGRQIQGEQVPIAKLTDADAIEARRRYAMGGISQAQLARECGISHATMGSLLNHETWKHLLTEEELQTVVEPNKRPGAKLTEEQVIEIRQRYAQGSITKTALAKEYGLGNPSLGDIINGVTWKHLL